MPKSSPARKSRARALKTRRRNAARARRWPWLLAVSLMLGLGASVYLAWLDHRIVSQFEAKRYAQPARVYSAPFDLHAGRRLEAGDLGQVLRLLDYRPSAAADQPGTYRRLATGYVLHTRGFDSPDGAEPARRVVVRFAKGRVSALEDDAGRPLALARLRPLLIAKIYPQSHEDRVLVRYDALPPLLPAAFVAVEDRRFYGHHGVDPVAVARALWADLKAGGFVQGGSTLTQQLVKNFYLSNRRSLWRKANEAIMAVLLEWHYDKRTLLETYLNEVYLGQDGRRAIHGVGLASEFYFGRPVQKLDPARIALLVALVRGPSYYDPRRHPERALARRNLVLRQMHAAGLIDAAALRRALSTPLGVTRQAVSGVTPYPAFVDLVRAQLARDYRPQDLRTQGLIIHTTLRPWVQQAAQTAVAHGLERIERARGWPQGRLQAAAVVASAASGEVYAVVGGRAPGFAGYNRALDARRSIGSLIKPAIYLAALEQPGRYTLASALDDTPLVYRSGGQTWKPLNYDRRFHGRVTLMDALVESYNVPSARLGLDVGLPKVIATAHALGIRQPIPEYPAVLLGAVPVPPIEVAQMYQTLAAGGYRAPLRAIQAVVDPRGRRLQRYPLTVQRVAAGEAVYLVDAALYEVTRRGTARAVRQWLGEDLPVAGKTGTTNALRDSWFAGFGGREVAVVWVGRDDDRPAGLTGASGALPLWADIMRAIHAAPLHMAQPAEVVWRAVDPARGRLVASTCPGAEWMPFIKGSEPAAAAGTGACREAVASTRPAGMESVWQ